MTYLSAFDTFCLFLALKNHFTQENYDFIKYNGKTSATRAAFDKRKDVLQFQKLSRKAHAENIQNYIIANLVAGRTWVGQFLEQEADAIYENFKKAVTDLIGTVASETKQALETHPRPFAIDKHEYPGILLCQLDGTVSYPTMVVLNNFIDFVPRYDDAYAGDEVWAATAFMIRKLRPFVSYDKKAMKDRLKEILL
jgi:hypothetical protein